MLIEQVSISVIPLAIVDCWAQLYCTTAASSLERCVTERVRLIAMLASSSSSSKTGSAFASDVDQLQSSITTVRPYDWDLELEDGRDIEI